MPPAADAAPADTRATACWIESPRRAALREQAVGPLAPGELRVRAVHGAVSRGTEMLVYRGEVPPGEYTRMRAPFQEGDWPGPVKYGYANVGRVVEGPEGRVGQFVFCLYPHQTEYRLPGSAAHPLPPDVPPARAVLAANMESALNAVWDLAPRPGDRVAVVGAGVLGLLAAWLVRRVTGVAVQLVDVLPERREVAHALGLDFRLAADAEGDCDAVLHASGQPAGLVTALSLAGLEATVAEMSWYGSRSVALPLGGAFHSRRLVLRSTQVGLVASAQRARWDPARRMGHALSLLADPVLDRLVNDHAPFHRLPETLARLAGPDASGVLCHRIDYPDH